MSADSKWIAISYTVPPVPSKGRVYVWRKLKEYGASSLNQSVSILPNSPENLNKFKKLKDKIISFEGSSVIFYVDFLEEADDKSTTKSFKEQTREEFRNIIADCANLISKLKSKPKQQVEYINKAKEINKSYKKAKEKQFFPEALSDELENEISEVKKTLKETAKEFHDEMKDLF